MKTLLLILVLPLSAEAYERRTVTPNDVRTAPSSVQRRKPKPSAVEEQGCQYTMQCGPGEVCLIPENQIYGACVDERSTVQ